MTSSNGRLIKAIFLSVLAHITLLGLVLLVSPWSSKNYVPMRQAPVEFEVMSQKETKTDRQIVAPTNIAPKEQIKEYQDKVKLLSDRAQRVHEEMQAMKNGLTRNRGGVNPFAQTRNTAKINKDALIGTQKPTQQQKGRQGEGVGSELGFSTVAEKVDAQHGRMTALNTDQYLFYSFFNRVNELVYVRWVPQIIEARDHMLMSKITNPYNSEWTTILDIWVKPNGEFHSAHLMKESGIRDFDYAAVRSFQQSGLFANPPRELIEEDGYIHLKYNMTVFFEPKVLSEQDKTRRNDGASVN